jgi:hypothetical protein
LIKQAIWLYLAVRDELTLARLRSGAERIRFRNGKTAGDQKETTGD